MPLAAVRQGGGMGAVAGDPRLKPFRHTMRGTLHRKLLRDGTVSSGAYLTPEAPSRPTCLALRDNSASVCLPHLCTEGLDDEKTEHLLKRIVL